MTTVEERVIRGFDYLTDYYGPEWQDAIDVETLDLSSACNCVLGQLANDYWDVYFNNINNKWHSMEEFIVWSYNHGFSIDETNSDSYQYNHDKAVADYKELTRTWRNKIG